MNELPDLPDALYTPKQVRELDRRAIEAHGIPGHVLMARAGRAAWRLLRSRYPDAARVLVLCGGGNNGGDGYVIARLAAEAGLQVDLCALVNPDRLTGDAARAANEALAVQSPVAFSDGLAREADVIVDALLGTGLDRPVTGPLADVIRTVNAMHCPVVAVDVPSGLSAATGKVLGVGVQAALTPTFIGLKQGLFTGDAADHVGTVVFSDLQVPAAVYNGIAPAAQRLTHDWLAAELPARQRGAHKGHFGHVLVAGGDHGMGGAVRIAAEAAARAGAGLTSVATRPAHVPAVLAARPELMVHGTDTGADIQALCERATVIAIGPGLGQDDWGRACLDAAESAGKPCVVDADALNLLAQSHSAPGRGDRVLTPHPGEAARLLGTTARAIESDRFAAATRLAERYGAVVVLKGAGTVIGDGRRCAVVAAGNPGLASGGMGDALTGVIAGLWAQGGDAWTAARRGALVHALAGDRAAAGGERGLLAGDVLEAVRRIVNP